MTFRNLLFLLFFSSTAILQAQKNTSTQFYAEVDTLLALAKTWEQEFILRKQLATSKALDQGWPIRQELEDGTVYEIVDFEGDIPEYRITYNLGAGRSTSTTRLHPDGDSPFRLSGEGMVIGEWDGGATRLSHQEFGGRAIQRDNATSLSSHATHVAGTLIGAGVRGEARGMAPQATLWTHDWNNDNAEMAAAAAQGLLISNHSYGSISGWARGDWSSAGVTEWHWWGDVNVNQEEDYKFGWYNQAARQWDQIAVNAPFYLIVKSAGNDRSDAGSASHKVSINGSWQSSTDFRQRDGGTDGYDCIPTYSNAKNILTIGAVSKIANGWTRPQDVSMSSFSGWGPTDDGRIKPDIVGAGVGLLSSNSSADDGYNSSSGTSMSGPNVAGSLLLLQELHQKLNGSFMRSATLKGLAIHTADEAGSSEGPDYRFGWGMLNTLKAADVLADPLNHQLFEGELQNNDVFEVKIYVSEGKDTRVTLCWTDPAAPASPAILNDRTLKLINDLDIRLIAAEDEEEVYFPYILDPANPNAPATKGDNFRDNVEMIFAAGLKEGSYIVRVSHKGTLAGGRQAFSLIISAPTAPCVLGIEADMRMTLDCANSAIEEVQVFESLDTDQFVFFTGTGDEQNSNLLTGLKAGLNLVFARDSAGCVAMQRVFIDAPQPITVSLEPQFVFGPKEGELFTNSVTFSSSTQSNWGGSLANQFIQAKIVPVDDGTPNPILGCEPLINSDAIAGNIALIRRGSCEFGLKALRAQQAGAVAVIIMNTEPGVIAMGGGTNGANVSIPAFMIPLADGQAILSRLEEEEEVIFAMGNFNPQAPESCEGRSDGRIAPLIAGGSGGFNFLWNTGDTSSALTNVPAGKYELLVTDSKNCAQEFLFEIASIPGPNIQLLVIDEKCEGEGNGIAQLMNASTLQQQFDILFSNGSSAMLQNELEPGSYSLTLTRNDGCIFSENFTIQPGANVRKPIIEGTVDIFNAQTYVFTVKYPFDSSLEFSWNAQGGVILAGQGTQEVLVLIDDEAERFELTVDVSQQLCTRSDTIIIENVTTSTQILDINQRVKMYPNPTQNQITIEFTEFNPVELQGELQILDLRGILIHQAPIQTSQILSMENWQPGVYLVRYKNYIGRIIKL
jgi:hypothetical protein